MKLKNSEELLDLIQKNAINLIEQAKTRPQKTMQYKLSKASKCFLAFSVSDCISLFPKKKKKL